MWILAEYQFLGKRNAGDCDTRLWKMGSGGQGNDMANNTNCDFSCGVVLLIYLAPKCEEQREVRKPDCNKSSEKIRAGLERDCGRGFQFWNFLYKVNINDHAAVWGYNQFSPQSHTPLHVFRGSPWDNCLENKLNGPQQWIKTDNQI